LSINLRRFGIGAAVISLSIILAACGTSTSTPAPTQEPIQQGQTLQQPVPAPAYDPPVQSNQDIFLEYIHSNFGDDVNDSSALGLANAICDSLGQGTDLLTIGQIGIDSGFTAEQAGKIVGASIAAFCPEYKYLVDQLQ